MGSQRRCGGDRRVTTHTCTCINTCMGMDKLMHAHSLMQGCSDRTGFIWILPPSHPLTPFFHSYLQPLLMFFSHTHLDLSLCPVHTGMLDILQPSPCGCRTGKRGSPDPLILLSHSTGLQPLSKSESVRLKEIRAAEMQGERKQ